MKSFNCFFMAGPLFFPIAAGGRQGPLSSCFTFFIHALPGLLLPDLLSGRYRKNDHWIVYEYPVKKGCMNIVATIGCTSISLKNRLSG